MGFYFGAKSFMQSLSVPYVDGAGAVAYSPTEFLALQSEQSSGVSWDTPTPVGVTSESRNLLALVALNHIFWKKMGGTPVKVAPDEVFDGLTTVRVIR